MDDSGISCMVGKNLLVSREKVMEWVRKEIVMLRARKTCNYKRNLD